MSNDLSKIAESIAGYFARVNPDNALQGGKLVATNVGDLREGKLWIIGKGKTQQQSIWLRVLWRRWMSG